MAAAAGVEAAQAIPVPAASEAARAAGDRYYKDAASSSVATAISLGARHARAWVCSRSRPHAGAHLSRCWGAGLPLIVPERFLVSYSFIPRNAVEVTGAAGDPGAMQALMSMTHAQLAEKLQNVRYACRLPAQS